MALKAFLAAVTTAAVSLGLLLPTPMHGHGMTKSQFAVTEVGRR